MLAVIHRRQRKSPLFLLLSQRQTLLNRELQLSLFLGRNGALSFIKSGVRQNLNMREITKAVGTVDLNSGASVSKCLPSFAAAVPGRPPPPLPHQNPRLHSHTQTPHSLQVAIYCPLLLQIDLGPRLAALGSQRVRTRR